VALAALVVMVATGTVRAIDELSSPADLVTTAYGLAIVAKIALIGVILVLAARNRRRNVPAADSDLRPLRRTSIGELGLATAALLAAAVLGALAPPVAAPEPAVAAQGISTVATDPAGRVRVSLTTRSKDPGPNTFTVRVADPINGAPLSAEDVRLRFRSLDARGVPATSLRLRPAPDGSYTGRGRNLAFGGRWRVTALIDYGAGSTPVPMTVAVRGRPKARR
jgi:hypothetical protein